MVNRLLASLYERQEGENTPLGILLCPEKGDEMIELLELGKSGIHVATYLTELPHYGMAERKATSIH